MHRITNFIHYLKAVRRLYTSTNKYHQRTGQRLLPLETVEERLNLCMACDHFSGRICKLCNCCTDREQSHFNKLAFPTEKCPDDPPKWGTAE